MRYKLVLHHFFIFFFSMFLLFLLRCCFVKNINKLKIKTAKALINHETETFFKQKHTTKQDDN